MKKNLYILEVSLAKKLDGSTPKTVDAATRKIERLMNELKEFEIFTETKGKKEGKICYYIEPTEKLVDFVSDVFFNVNETQES